MSALITERRKGAAIQIKRDYLESLVHIRCVLMYYNDNCSCLVTNENCRKCFGKLAREKRHAKDIYV